MLSAMTTSENFPLPNQPGCPRPSYNTVIQSTTYLANFLRQNSQIQGTDDGGLMSASAFSNGKTSRSFYYQPLDSKRDKNELLEDSEDVFSHYDEDSNCFTENEVPKSDFETDLTNLLDQVEIDDGFYEQSKPLKIDPAVFKLDFSKLSFVEGYKPLDKLCINNLSELKRTSHHLSGGGLLTETLNQNSENSSSDSSKSQLCKFSGGGLVTNEKLVNLENICDVELCSSGVSNFLNQISPSSPLTFDLTGQSDKERNVTSETSSKADSTNPFKNVIKGALEAENSFSPTNPFRAFCVSSSSPNEIPSITHVPPKYENISLPQPQPQKSFSQCSTRPASPVLTISEEFSVSSNPFSINNKTSLEPYPVSTPKIIVNESSFESRATALPNSSSLILVPVFPIFQHNITNSSTQTVDLTELPKPEEPVYQNVTHQLRKFMKTNNHSEYDLQCLKTTVKDLRMSGWYYENVSWQESVVLLSSTEPGTFLIRDSSDPNFLFSLSVQTSRGPTSVRLHYVNGQFRLDAEKKLIPHMPSFNSVIELIDYYVENTVKNKPNNKVSSKSAKKLEKHKAQKSKNQVWIDSQGNVYSNILLVKPLYKKDHFSTLQHLSRLVINRCIRKRLNAKVKLNFRVTPVYESSPFEDSSFQNNFDNFCPALSIDSLPLPTKLLEYLKEYPYCS